MPHNLLTISLQSEHDVVLARQRAGQVASLLGFSLQDQSRIATSVSEIARNAYEYARGGLVYFRLVFDEATLQIEVRDKGVGISALEAILNGDYKSPTGMGLGILGTKRLMDKVEINTSSKGTAVVLEKRLPVRTLVNDALLRQVMDGLAQQNSQSLLAELQNHNQEMLQAMTDLQAQQQQLIELNQELEDTNRGVVALYAELDERAELLVKSNEIKTRFLSNISHELRTPLNAILSLSNLLLSRADGDLTQEQEKQVGFIRRSAESLSGMVNDVLDLAKVDAGMVAIRAENFEVENLFSALRGMLRPLLGESQNVNLVFEEENEIPSLYTDEGKVSQILRNFISNAIKFTTEGEVKVTASLEGDRVLFKVSDTGIGIDEQDLEYIFEEFTQLESSLHKRTKGTGLGLPLARKLAQLLGGEVDVESEIGQGSCFYCMIPLYYQGSGEGNLVGDSPKPAAIVNQPLQFPVALTQPITYSKPVQGELKQGQSKVDVLMIDNDPAHIYLLRNKLDSMRLEVREAHDGMSGLKIAQSESPRLIFLDLVMPHMDGFAVLEALRDHDATRQIPIIIHTSKDLSPAEEKSLLRGCQFIVKKEEGTSPAGTEKIQKMVGELLERKSKPE